MNPLPRKIRPTTHCNRPGAIREKLQNVTISPAGLRKISFTIERFQKVHYFLSISHELGILIADEKSVGPVTVWKSIRRMDMAIRIPQEKLEVLKADLIFYSEQKRITLKNLQSLVGSLNFFGKAIRSARAFNRRFYDLTMKAKKPHHFIKLNAERKADMHMWLYFLESFNGKTYFPESSWTDSDVLGREIESEIQLNFSKIC
jgi:hypothetical protein